MRKAIVLGLVFLAFGPASFLLALGVLMNPAAQASCLPDDVIPGSRSERSPMSSWRPRATASAFASTAAS